MTEKITAADAIRLLDTGKAVAVDVREPDEYAVGHIPGAKLLPLGQVIDRAAEVLPDKNACGWCTAAPDAAAPTLCRSWKPWLHPPAGPWRHFKLALRDRGRF